MHRMPAYGMLKSNQNNAQVYEEGGILNYQVSTHHRRKERDQKTH
jgi:hypothetical protein